MQVFMVTGLFAGQHNTKLHGTITGVISRGLEKTGYPQETTTTEQPPKTGPPKHHAKIPCSSKAPCSYTMHGPASLSHLRQIRPTQTAALMK